jgi:hypothetical protein
MDFLMRTDRFGRVFAIALLGISLSPGVAHAGFFDFLFQQFQPPNPRYFPRPPAYRPWGHANGFRRHKVVAHRNEKAGHPVRPHAPVDIMNDESLQEGDAVMTRSGIRIFVGDYGSHHHKAGDFRKLSEIKGLSKRERKSLAELDAPRSISSTDDSKAGLVTGRSATEAGLSAGKTFTDARGRTIRYVGP